MNRSTTRLPYASPTVATLGGQRQLLVMTAKRAVGLTVDDGRLLWEYPWVTEHGINAAQPIAVAANRVYLSSGYGQGAAVLELTRGATVSGLASSGPTPHEEQVQQRRPLRGLSLRAG